MEPVWERLKAKYFKQWQNAADTATWVDIKLKLDFLDDFRGELRKMANSGEIDNA
jgi:hypothetical protein